MSGRADEATDKLCIDVDGYVWRASGLFYPANSGKKVVDFLATVEERNTTFRLIGDARTAELISGLYGLRAKQRVGAVEVVSPRFFPQYCAEPPFNTLLRMRGVVAPASCGGWNEVDFAWFATYAMVARFFRGSDLSDGAVENYLKFHPVWRALLFMPKFNIDAVVSVLTTIINPRWFVDTRRPHDPGKLFLYLGLTPAVQARVSAPDAFLATPREVRCAQVFRCWATDDPAPALTDPANFVHRVRERHDGSRGDLRASQKFVDYLRLNWLDALTRRSGPQDRVFAPDLFFSSADEVAAYRLHMKAVRK